MIDFLQIEIFLQWVKTKKVLIKMNMITSQDL